MNYVEKEFSPNNYLSIRNEYFNDIAGNVPVIKPSIPST